MFRRCSEPFEKTRFFTFESQLKKLNYYSILLLLAIQKILHFEVKVCKRFDPGKGKEGALPHAIF